MARSNQLMELLGRIVGAIAFPNCWHPAVEWCGANDKQRCDLVIEQADKLPVWVEVKGCWRVLVNDDNMPGSSNAAFVKHLHRAAHDVDKLLSIPSTSAHVGLLIVGFDTEDRPVTDEHLSIVRERAKDWQESSETWDDSAYPGFRIQCWFWSQTRATSTQSANAGRNAESLDRW